MAVERNHAIAFVLVLVHFLIGSKNGEELLCQFKYRRLFNRKSFWLVKKTSRILVLVGVSLFHLTFSKYLT